MIINVIINSLLVDCIFKVDLVLRVIETGKIVYVEHVQDYVKQIIEERKSNITENRIANDGERSGPRHPKHYHGGNTRLSPR